MNAPLPGRVLVAIDFDEASASAVEVAGALAQAFGAALTVLHAETLEMPPYFTSAQMETLEAERREARAAATEYVREFAARHTSVPFETVVVDGPPAEAVLQRAPAFDLVALGTHGRRGPRRWWLGSVAEAVVEGATTPVLVTRAVDESARAAFRERRVTVAAADGGGEAVARWARLLEQALHATVVRVAGLEACQPDRLRRADLVLASVAAHDGKGRLTDTVVHVLQGCERPVLFVPAGRQAPERRSP